METPAVLVVIPLYNASAYIKKAVEAVLRQDYINFSVLIIDDGSTDGSGDIVRSIKDDRITVWEQENQGPAAAMNRAIKYAMEENIPFIARADADDIMMPNRISSQISLLLKHPDAAACSANGYYIDEQTEKKVGKSTVPVSSQLIKWEINQGLRGLIQPVCTFRTEALNVIRGYRPHIIQAEDIDLFLRLVEKYRVINCPDYLCSIRFRKESFSTGNVRVWIENQFYAMDCAKRRRKGREELEFVTFLEEMSWYLKLLIWKEEQVLRFWRKGFTSSKPIYKILASLLDPRRVIVRVLRMIDSRIYQYKIEKEVTE